MKPLPAGVVFGLCLLTVAPSNGQTRRTDRPYQGLFGGGVANSGEVLTVSGLLGGGYDDNILLDLPGGGFDPRAKAGGSLGQTSGSLNYSRSGNKVSAGASLGSDLRDHPDLLEPFLHAHSAAAGASMRVRQNTVLAMSQTASYQPYSFATFFPLAVEVEEGQTAPADLDVSLTHDQYFSYNGSVGLDQRVGRRAFWSGNYDYRVRNASAHTPRYTSQGAGTDFRVGVSRDVSLRFGYNYELADYEAGGRVQDHEASGGFEVVWAHSASRQTTLSLDAGASAVVYTDSTRYLSNVNARLTHDLGRTWSTSLAYRRGLEFVETLAAPVYGDSATVQLTGLLGRRVQFRSSAHASVGDVGFSANSRYDTYLGTAGVSMGLTRHVALGVEYSFYHYRFQENVFLPPGTPRDSNRQSVRAHVNLWALLLNRPKAPNAP